MEDWSLSEGMGPKLSDRKPGNDDAHQSGDHSRFWNFSRRNIRPLRD